MGVTNIAVVLPIVNSTRVAEVRWEFVGLEIMKLGQKKPRADRGFPMDKQLIDYVKGSYQI